MLPLEKKDSRAHLKAILCDTPSPSMEGHPSTLDYRVKVPIFEGPLDLLLHLIRKDQVNIYDIPVAQICQNYLEYISRVEALDVNLAGEFMAMAANLIHLKSQMLLPSEEVIAEEEDPRLPLVAQLVELEKFKSATGTLDGFNWLTRDIFARPSFTESDLVTEGSLSSEVEHVDPFQLLMALKVVTDRTQRKIYDVATDSISIRDKVSELVRQFDQASLLNFSALLPLLCRRLDIVVSFLVILELSRLKFLEIFQGEAFGSIELRKMRPFSELDLALLDHF